MEPEDRQDSVAGRGEFARDQARANNDPAHQRMNLTQSKNELLGPFTVFCLVMNRTIGSGIFTQPYNIAVGAGSSGAALLMWLAGGVIALCITACWLEFGLSVPRHHIFGEREKRPTPRSGGDKNYLEYVYGKPAQFITCVFGIPFLIFGNLAGNALQLGIFMTTAQDPSYTGQDQNGKVVAWALAALTLTALVNISTRKFSIWLNNGFGIIKVALLVVTVFLGIGFGTARGNRCREISFAQKGVGGGAGDFFLALFYALYPYTGYEQPFYVLAEVAKPQQRFARPVVLSMFTVLALYPLVNVAFFCVNPFEGPLILGDASAERRGGSNAALKFFSKLAQGSGSEDGALQAGSLLLAAVILGNLLAQSYTTTRVKQEIAKEGILPYWSFFAAGSDTLFSRWSSRRRGRTTNPYEADPEVDLEQTPMAATFVHWFFASLLVAVAGATTPPDRAYTLLTYVYTFVVVGFFGLLTAGGLLYLKIDSWLNRSTAGPGGKRRGRRWADKTAWTPWVDPLPCIVATVALGILVVGGSATATSALGDRDVQWWVRPLVGWCAVVFGTVWWSGLWVVQWKGRWRLDVRRVIYVEADEEDDVVVKAELVIVKKRPRVEQEPGLSWSDSN